MATVLYTLENRMRLNWSGAKQEHLRDMDEFYFFEYKAF